MPATEKTWRDQKVLHIVFAFTSVAMLLTTFFMFAWDHNRSWKGYQSRARDIERRITNWRLDSENSTANQRLQAELNAAINREQSQPIPGDLYARLRKQVDDDEKRLADIPGRELRPHDFSTMDSRNAELAKAANVAAQKRADANARAEELQQLRASASQAQAQLQEAKSSGADASIVDQINAQVAQFAEQDATLRETLTKANEAAEDAEAAAGKIRSRILDEMNKILARAKQREDVLASDRKFTGADFDAAKANLGLGVRDGRPTEELSSAQGTIDPIKAKLDELTLLRDDAIDNREAIQDIIREITAPETELKTQLADSLAEAERLATAISERNSQFFDDNGLPGKRWLELPILNAFNSPLKIDNLWTESTLR